MRGPENVPARRQAEQTERDAYRTAAQRWAPVGVRVDPYCHVQLVEDGAFVECQVFLPADALRKQ